MTGTKDWALILELISSAGKIVGRTKLQKLAFLAKKEGKLPLSFNFPVYYYGPYSEELQQIVDTMVAAGFVKEEVFQPNSRDEESVGYIYSLTEDGKEFSKQLSSELTEEEMSRLQDLVKQYGYRPLREVLDYVYAQYVH